ncbi:hypothetical protein ACRWQN_17670 [Shewanella sp. HL-SH8]|uniref:hypothetical protein n=1 Tax=Shewanella sp. HL-SH8 TaxID=3436242 RepID=UPI003EBB023D
MSVVETLRNSIRTGEIVTIIYHGGSNPGASREIFPVGILSGDEKLRARCIVDGATKVFKIDKISIVDADGVIDMARDISQSKLYTSLKELYLDAVPLFDAEKFHIELGDNELSVHKKWKNGKHQKGVVINIYYQEAYTNLVFNYETSQFDEVTKKPQRPWCIFGKNVTPNSYKDFNKAAYYFIEQIDKAVTEKNIHGEVKK